MTSATATGAQPKWLAEGIRVTIFFPVGTSPPALSWAKTVGATPQIINQRPVDMMVQEGGDFSHGILLATSQPGRADWVYRPSPPNPSLPPPQVASVGLFSDALPELIAVAKKWLNTGIQGVRIAVGAVLIEQVPSLKDGVKRVAPLLPFVRLESLPEAGLADFLLAANLPSVSAVKPGLRINRLTKWQVNLSEVMTVVPGPAAQFVAISGGSGSPTPAARLEIDVNTDGANAQLFSTTELVAILDELVPQVEMLAQKGAVP